MMPIAIFFFCAGREAARDAGDGKLLDGSTVGGMSRPESSEEMIGRGSSYGMRGDDWKTSVEVPG